MVIITNKQLADLLKTPYREVSQKLGGLDVSASGSRAQLSVLEPLVLKNALLLSLLPALAKESEMIQNAGLN